MPDKDKGEKVRDEYEAMVAARKQTAESTTWLDRVLSSIDELEERPGEGSRGKYTSEP